MKFGRTTQEQNQNDRTGVSIKNAEKLAKLPIVETWLETSKDKKFLIHKRLETTIYSEKYLDKVYEDKKE